MLLGISNVFGGTIFVAFTQLTTSVQEIKDNFANGNHDDEMKQLLFVEEKELGNFLLTQDTYHQHTLPFLTEYLNSTSLQS